METPNIWERLFYIAIIVVSMVFGGHLYPKKADQPAKKKRPKKKH